MHLYFWLSSLTASWSVGNAFVSGVGGLKFKLSGQIEHCIATGFLLLQHFFEGSYVARVQWCCDEPLQHFMHFDVLQHL